MPRRALLIGIDNYLDESLALVAPGNDVRELERVLTHTGFSADAIHSLIGSAGASLTANSLRKQIRDFYRSAEPEDDLFMLISAHGIQQGEHRLVVPNDYYLEDPQPPSSLVGDQFLYGEAAKSRARSIVILIDACREGVRFKLVEEKGLGSEPERPSRSDVPTVAIVYSCAQGELSFTDGGAEGLSFFTAALCAVLEADNEIATLGDTLQAVEAELKARLIASSLPPQAVTLCERPIVGRGGAPERLLIKENRAARTRQRIADSRWCHDLANSPLWSKLRDGWPTAATQVQWIVLNAEETFRQAEHKLPEQRWRDERAPARALRSLDVLLRHRSDVLSISEIAIALALPFVYEGVLAAGELLIAKQGDALNPQSGTSEAAVASRPWLAWQSNHNAEEAYGRRAAILQSQGLTDAAVDLVAWQLVRFLHANGELWEYSPKQAKYTVGWVSEQMHAWFAPAPLDGVSSDAQVARLLEGRRLVRLARLAFATPEDVEIERGEGKDNPLRTELFIGRPDVDRRVNELMLAHLSNLAFSLATDARRLSPLFAEHLGRPEFVTARFLQQTLQEITWHTTQSDTIDAALDCPHEVIDLALTDAIEQLNRHRVGLNQTLGFPEALLTSIPRFFGAGAVRARVDADDKPLYRVPHLRLTLEHSRIREILMGEQLYGSSKLALRELYQNALDAIRYRRSRMQYLRAIGRRVDEYVGRIELRAGVEDGRRYIECRDNGIGMGERHVRNLFARAGSRFTESHEFHLERARWAEQGVKFWPNSRFGIGVFSYFMMADEIRVETKRLKEDGFDCEPGLILSVVGSGSLFRVQRGEGIAPGTTVRLYLNDPDQAEVMAENVLRWLWLPEFETLLFDVGGACTKLEAGQPSPTMVEECGAIVAVPESAGTNGQPRLFWVYEQELRYSESVDAHILVDGVHTQFDDGQRLPCDGVVVNVTEDLRVDLSVDRARIKNVRTVADWLADQVRRGAYRYLLQLPNLRLLNFEQAFMRKPLVLIHLDRALRAHENGLSGTIQIGKQKHSLPLAGLGLSPTLDHLAFENWPDDASDVPKEPMAYSLLQALTNSPLRAPVMRMVAARICAITAVAEGIAPWAWQRLAAFARHEEWQDHPSMGLLAGVIARRPPRDLQRDWCLNAEESALVIQPLHPWLAVAGAEVWGGDRDDDWGEDGDGEESTPGPLSLQQFIARLRTPQPVHIALAAIRFRRSQQEILDAVRRVHRHAPGLENFVPEAVPLPASWRPFSLLSVSFLTRYIWMERRNGKRPLSNRLFDLARFYKELPTRLELTDLLFAASELRVSLQTVAEWARPLPSWGVSVWDVSVLPQDLLNNRHVPQVFEFERGDSGALLVTLPLLGFAVAARESTMTPAEIVELLRPLERFGIAIPTTGSVPAQPLGDSSWDLLTADLWEGPDLPEELTARNLAHVSLAWSLPLDTVIEAARPLRTWGVALPDLDALPPGLVPKERLQDIFLDDDEELLPYSPGLVLKSTDLRGPALDKTLETFRPWIALLYDKPLPPTPFTPDRCLKYLLATRRYQLWTDTLSAWDLAVTAHKHENDPAEYLAALEQLAQFGVNVEEAKAFAQFCQNQS